MILTRWSAILVWCMAIGCTSWNKNPAVAHPDPFDCHALPYLEHISIAESRDGLVDVLEAHLMRCDHMDVFAVCFQSGYGEGIIDVANDTELETLLAAIADGGFHG